MLALLAQLAPAAGYGFWRTPSAYTVLDIFLTVCIGVAVALLWRRFTRWRKTTAPLFAQVGRVMGDLAGVKGDLAKVQRDMVDIRHDVGAVGEKVGELGATLGADIVESEERLAEKLGEIADAQIVLMQTLSSRPCIVREKEARDECSEGEE